MFKEGIWEIGENQITGYFEKGKWEISSVNIKGFHEQILPDDNGSQTVGVFMSSITFSEPYLMFSYQKSTENRLCQALKDFSARNSLLYKGLPEARQNSQAVQYVDLPSLSKQKGKMAAVKSIFFWLIWSLLLLTSLIMVIAEFSGIRLVALLLLTVFLLVFRKRLFIRFIPALLIWGVVFIGFLAIIGLTENVNKVSVNSGQGLNTKGDISQTRGDLTVTLPNWVLPEGQEIVVKRDENPPAAGSHSDVVFQAYDIELPQAGMTDGIAEIAIPFDKTMLSKGVDPVDAVGAAYYDPQLKDWVSMPCMVDTQRSRVIIYTDHFSKFAAVILKDGRKKLSETLPNYDYIPTDFYSQADLAKIVAEGAAGGAESATALEKGWSRFNELYGFTGASSSVLEAAVGTETLKNVNKLMNEAGLGFALTQLAYDIYSGNDKTAAVQSFTKSSAFYSVSKWGGDALGLASAGVTFMDLALNKFGETALDKNLQKWEGAYRKYYTTEPNARRTAVEWYKIVAQLNKESKNGKEFQAKLDAEVTAYSNKFWLDAEAYAAVAESTPGIRGFGAGGEDAAGKEKINANFKAFLYQNTIQQVLAHYVKKQWFNTYQKAETEFNTLKAEMNKVYTVTVQLDNYQSVKNLAATTVRFVDKNGNVVHGQSFDASGKAVLKMSLYGFIKAGGPVKVEVRVPVQDSGSDFTTSTTYKLDKTNVNVNVPYTPPEKNEPKEKAGTDKPVPQEEQKPKETPNPEPVTPAPASQPEVKPIPPNPAVPEYDYQAALAVWAADFAAEVNNRVYDDGVCKSTSEFEWVMQPVIRDGQVVGASRIWQTNAFYAGEHAGKTVRGTVNEAYDPGNPGVYISVGELRQKYPQFESKKN